MQAWAPYYGTIGAAAATLLGLLFVAVSVNASAALGSGDRLTRGMTEQAFQNYLTVMMVALLALFPRLEVATFGLVCFVAVAARAVWVAVRIFQSLGHRGPRQSLTFELRRHFASVVGFGLLLVAAARMAMRWGEDFNMLAASALVIMFSATTVSWELLRRIANPTEE